ncbi:serine hydrolase [Mucilaginibacter sp. E4BP6]|uniref:serine hydrolase n=1 Tax=Mucilaginibacter sp. E4BP6 TaxID=2723089 RepID=UPI0015C75EA9|nr:serine hydrolase [Mucilaginibacter sp. E4BP6]NYE67095.1 CubicO group peptidase (beta-lactamase class C family) [Mucilaginibacter sp. E4BP6]
MKKIIFFLLFNIFTVMFCFAQQPSFITNDLDAYINKGLKDWNLPGLAIAIVKDGKVVVMKGYGVRNVKTNEPVDENTLFMIASNTKLFTATALAQLDYDKKISLNDKISKYFPDYTLYDPNTSALVTVRDMLSHHIGTKTFQGDFTYWNSTYTRKQIMDKMKLMKPVNGFRQTFGYCNSCFLTAGQVIEAATGKPWETEIRDSILTPMGMTNTYTSGADMANMKDAAQPYSTFFTGQLTALPYDRLDNLAPAASLVSCVKDLAKWLTMQLDSGKFEGKQIIEWKALQKTRDMNTVITSRKSPYLPSNFSGYGLGVDITDYNGKQVFSHTGGADGFVTNTCFVPEEHLAITILTNNDNQDFFEALRYQILDAYLGVQNTDRSAFFLKYFNQEMKETVKTTTDMQARVKGKIPELSLSAYAGTYANELYGTISVTADKKGLSVKFNNHVDYAASLKYMDNGEWLLTYTNASYGIFPLKFTIENGKVVSTVVKVNDELEYDPYLFTKVD